MSTVRVQREGGRGHHLIAKAKYDADPKAYVRCDETGAAIEAAKTSDAGPGPRAEDRPCVFCGVVEGERHLEGCRFFESVGDDLWSKTIPELRALASDRNIDLGDATKKADIIAVIEAVAKA